MTGSSHYHAAIGPESYASVYEHASLPSDAVLVEITSWLYVKEARKLFVIGREDVDVVGGLKVCFQGVWPAGSCMRL